VEVFGRRPSYDPRIDAVVRTEAVKLRARLKQYYDSEGREDRLIIDLPKGGYVPVFRLRQEEINKTPEPLPVPRVKDAPRRAFVSWKSAIAVVFITLLVAITTYAAIQDSSGMFHGQVSQTPTIAVLPFEDLSPDGDQESLCDGLTEQVIDALTKVGGFRVVARTSSFAFKGASQDIREIGKKLNVLYVLEGSVRKDGHLLRVTAQLNSVADGYHLWSETYQRELNDVFAVQDEISKAIVSKIPGRAPSF